MHAAFGWGWRIEDHLGGYSSGPVVDLQPRLSLDLMISHLKIVNIDQINQNTRSLSVWANNNQLHKIIFIYICIYQTVIVKWFISGFLIRNDRRSVVRFGPGPESPLDWTVRGPCFGISTFNLSFGLNLWSFDSFHLSYATCYLVQIIVGTISFNFLVFSKLCSHHLV